MSKFKNICISLFIVACIFGIMQALGSDVPQTSSTNGINFSKLAKCLMLEKGDFRYEFYASYNAFTVVKQKGNFLFSLGAAENTREISTNECPTVEAALNKYGGGPSNFQIRLVEQNRIVQTPAARFANVEGIRTVLNLPLQSGDVIIVTLKE